MEYRVRLEGPSSPFMMVVPLSYTVLGMGRFLMTVVLVFSNAAPGGICCGCCGCCTIECDGELGCPPDAIATEATGEEVVGWAMTFVTVVPPIIHVSTEVCLRE